MRELDRAARDTRPKKLRSYVQQFKGGRGHTQGLRVAGEGERAERFSIEAFYYYFYTGELEKAAQTYELWQQTYPRDDLPYRELGILSGRLGNWNKAVEEHREALRLEPNDVFNYGNLAFDYTALNRLDEAEAVYKQMEERKLE